ncbi:MAG TPA: NADH pyrophosphatase, partial [Novosphingobium sp.]|nr:NADH pyrophosphatase [Novosphingobium sp.]
DVSYVASQPWPFPSSLMIGCHAHALNDEIVIDRTELDEAGWFTRDEVAAAMRGEEDARFIAPPPQAIAHHLLRWWLER